MNGRRYKVGLAFACVVSLAGCRDGAGPASVGLGGITASVPADSSALSDVSDLGRVLAEAVDKDGRLVPGALGRVRGRLDAQLRKMARAGPTSRPELFPTDASRWAYWYNAHVAWSIKLADLAGCPRSDCPPGARRRAFRLDGREMTLGRIDSIILAEARRVGDFRLAACLPGVWVDHAPLPSQPLSGEGFADFLGGALNRLVMDRRRLAVDVEKRRVRVPTLLWACRDMVVSSYRRRYGPVDVTLTTALRPHLDSAGRTRMDEALGYTVAPHTPEDGLVVARRRIYFPGKIGRVEP